MGLKYIKPKSAVAKFEELTYKTALYEDTLFAQNFCVVSEDVPYSQFNTEDEFKAAALFNLSDHSVLLAEHMHDLIYPASTTKLMTFHLAMKYSNLEEIVTVSESATTELPAVSTQP